VGRRLSLFEKMPFNPRHHEMWLESHWATVMRRMVPTSQKMTNKFLLIQNSPDSSNDAVFSGLWELTPTSAAKLKLW
jgi:hypothetical protein